MRLIDGAAQLVIAPHGSAQFSAIPLGTGSWKITLEGAGAAQLSLLAAPAGSDCASCVQADANGLAAVTIRNDSGQPAVLKSIQLTAVAASLRRRGRRSSLHLLCSSSLAILGIAGLRGILGGGRGLCEVVDDDGDASIRWIERIAGHTELAIREAAHLRDLPVTQAGMLHQPARRVGAIGG